MANYVCHRGLAPLVLRTVSGALYFTSKVLLVGLLPRMSLKVLAVPLPVKGTFYLGNLF
jgi:hypothetical protein